MARRRRKQRTHVKDPQNPAKNDVPRSFVIKHGQVGSSITQLVRDMRKVMEPNTASRLKERARNKLKDYIVMGPSLHVSHLLAFTLTPVAPILRIIRLPAGPTLTFRIERYSLAKDVINTSKRARSMGLESLTPPLLVCASFPQGPGAPPHISLLVKSFQSLLPSLSPATLNLASARRVLLLSYNAATDTIDLRHYLITVKPYGISKRIQKVVNGPVKSRTQGQNVLNLGKEKDIADFFLRQHGDQGPDTGDDDGYESAASSASSIAEDGKSALELPGDYLGRNNRKGEKRAVKLDEIGPRMELSLLKMSEGQPGKEGSVIYHRFVKKTKKEVSKLQAKQLEQAKLKRERREQQERNVAAKSKRAVEEDDTEDEQAGLDVDAEWDEEVMVSESDEDGDGDEESSTDDDTKTGLKSRKPAKRWKGDPK